MATSVGVARVCPKLLSYLAPAKQCNCGTTYSVMRYHKYRGIHCRYSSSYVMFLRNQEQLAKCPSVICNRYSSTNHRWQMPSQNIDPGKLVEAHLSTLHGNIRKELVEQSKESARSPELVKIAQYHFDGKGKAFRPMLIYLLARSCNTHNGLADGLLLASQSSVAMIAEMIHTASLVHDDVIDKADTRRGQASVAKAWGERKAILAGNFIMSVASTLLARIGNEEVVEILSQVLEDLVRGEFMQLGSKEDENERFAHYLKKTFKKTASLIANSCKAVAVLGGCTEEVIEIAYQYGRNVGIAFQLIDDLLDFISSEALMGKPAVADLRLGLATAPVLFAAQQYPELNAMIMRRFQKSGDVERAHDLVSKSDGVSQTRYLAEQHCKEAVQQISKLSPSVEQHALIAVTNKVLNRLK